MKYIFFILSVLVLSSCNPYGFEIWPEGDPHWGDPVPVVQIDTCENYLPAELPKYFQGWVELEGVANNWVLNVGPYTDTIHAGEESQLDSRLTTLINAYLPSYQTEVFSREDINRIATFTKGTDNAALLNWYVFIRLDNAKYYPVFSKRAFYLGGAATKDEFVQLADEYRSMTGFNLRDLLTDSIGENQAMLAVLDSCKDGTNKRADFRFNIFPPSDSIVDAFQDAHWNVIQSFSGGGSSSRTLYSGNHKIGILKDNILDARGYKISDEEILEMLNSGIQVITDL